ncbi:MAG: hypothetical protein HW421_3486 [Ignavibacteria bacterium]|nr:hypothetical protein [Ignavibacteria bacterium]
MKIDTINNIICFLKRQEECHSERSEESSPNTVSGFFTSFRMTFFQLVNIIFNSLLCPFRVILIVLFFLLFTFNSYSQWEKITTIPPPYDDNYWLEVYFLNEEPDYGWVCGFRGQIIRTTDGGNTWAGSTIDGYWHFEGIHFADKLNGFVSGNDKLFKTTDGGISWSDVTPPQPKPEESVSRSMLWGNWFISKDTGMVVGDGCGNQPQFFYKTVDGGTTWKYFKGTVKNSSLTDLILYKNSGLGYATGSGYVFVTTDTGNTWSEFTYTGGNDWQEDLHISGNTILVPYDPFCSGRQDDTGGIRISRDFGATWNDYPTGKAMYGAYLIDSLKGWVCGIDRAIYQTTDGGQHWELRHCGICDTCNLDDFWFFNDSTGFVVGEGVYRYNPESITYRTSNSATFCEGDTITIGPGNFYTTYLWNTSDTTNKIKVAQSGIYSVIGKDTIGCFREAIYEVYFKPPPEPEIIYNDKIYICISDSLYLHIPDEYTEYNWYQSPNKKIINAKSNQLAIRQSGKYFVRVRDKFGCIGQSFEADVNVKYDSAHLRLVDYFDNEYIDFDTVTYPAKKCRTFKLKNVSKNEKVVINYLFLSQNQAFSAPVTQYPIELDTGETKIFKICFAPTHLGIERDTIIHYDLCGNKKIPLVGFSKWDYYSAYNRCDIPFKLKTKKLPHSYIFEASPPYPNPSNSTIHVPFGRLTQSNQEKFEQCRLYNTLGSSINITDESIIEESIDGDWKYQGGEYLISTVELESGLYFININSPSGNFRYTIVVDK